METDTQFQTFCYISTPGHLRSFMGTFIYIYTDEGQLSLDSEELVLDGTSESDVRIPLDQVLAVKKGHYSRWAKPIRLDYISITFQDENEPNESGQQTLLLTPTKSLLTPVWQTNHRVAKWLELLQALCPDARGEF